MRVDGCSKIMASTAPGRNLDGVWQTRAAHDLHGMSLVEDRAQSLAIQRVNIEKMPRLHGGSLGSLALGLETSAVVEARAGGIELGAGKVDLGFTDNERRQEAHDVVAGLHR